MSKPKEPTLEDIAGRICEHIKRFERDPKINTRAHGKRGLKLYFWASAFRAGRYVAVTYISYQGASNLTKAEALAYLAWLDAGNVGKHWNMSDTKEA